MVRQPKPLYLRGLSTKEIWIEGAMVLLLEEHRARGEELPAREDLRLEAQAIYRRHFPARRKSPARGKKKKKH